MKPVLVRVSAQPLGWTASRAIGRRRPVLAWTIFRENDGREVVSGMVARGQTLVRGDRVPGFIGYAAGAGCEPALEAPPLPPADLDDAMHHALAFDADSWDEYEARIRENLTAVASNDWASAALAGFDMDSGKWFRLWLSGRREHEQTERDLWRRLRALSLVAPGRTLEEALAVVHISLGALLAAPDPPTTHQRKVRARAGARRKGAKA